MHLSHLLRSRITFLCARARRSGDIRRSGHKRQPDLHSVCEDSLRHAHTGAAHGGTARPTQRTPRRDPSSSGERPAKGREGWGDRAVPTGRKSAPSMQTAEANAPRSSSSLDSVRLPATQTGWKLIVAHYSFYSDIAPGDCVGIVPLQWSSRNSPSSKQPSPCPARPSMLESFCGPAVWRPVLSLK
jgi:hypothetical protein